MEGLGHGVTRERLAERRHPQTLLKRVPEVIAVAQRRRSRALGGVRRGGLHETGNQPRQSGSGSIRRMNLSNSGTVNAVSP